MDVFILQATICHLTLAGFLSFCFPFLIPCDVAIILRLFNVLAWLREDSYGALRSPVRNAQRPRTGAMYHRDSFSF